MTSLILETCLILLLAYFVGALLGCFARKFFPADHVTQPRVNQPGYNRPAINYGGVGSAVAGAAGAATVGGAITHNAGHIQTQTPKVSPTTVPVQPAVVPPATVPVQTRPVAPPKPVVAPTPTPTTVQQSPVAQPIPQRVPAAPSVPKVAPVQTPTVPYQPSAPIIPPQKPVVAPQTTSTSAGSGFLTEARGIPTPTVKQEHDDLSKIKGLGSIMALKLNKIGITRFDQIAKWNQNDVLLISKQLDFSGRIEREDWVGQARRLLVGQDAVVDGTTDYAHTKRKTSFPSQSGVKVSETSSLSLSVSGLPDDLKRIAGVGIVLEEKLNELGYTHFEHIKNLTPYDIQRISKYLEFTGRIEREDWMGQAQRLIYGR